MARIRLVAGNWKMHGSRAANRALLDAILEGLPKGAAQGAVCPPFPYLAEVAERLRGTPLALGAQNVSEHAQGAYTGEVSAAMLADVDGGLIGGASLVAADFLAILQAAGTKKVN